ncbi:Nitrous oxide reductase maturation protein NosD [hydrothermal vent metagenome]|uniref:Nitrous oxide reductase maturation protein NosD n=1 Tax=hydrothermal vent metagenome TaxID=652676 RepID=A0A3B0VRU1_9ZZZZ
MVLLLGSFLVGGSSVLAHTEGDAIRVTAEELATAVANAQPGDTIEVTGGTFAGFLEVDKPLTLIGVDWPVLDGENKGTVLKITAPRVTVRGFVIKNSGDSLDQENSGLVIEAADALIENNRLEEILFGIYLRHAHNGILRNNVISSKDLDVPRRGDAIRVWYSNDVTIEDNVITRGRDVVLWYSERLTVRNNEVSNGRYGLHFMYGDDAIIENNRLLNNSVGIYMMYSRRLQLLNNTIAGNRGPSGYGIGLKDMDYAIVRNNIFLDNRIGVHLDNSPREVDSVGLFEGNVFGYNDIGVNFLPSVRNNQFSNNSFIENEEQVGFTSGGNLAESNVWTINGRGNYWSDYAGYDVAGDGLGDMSYRSEKLFEAILTRQPELRLFLYSPAVTAVDFAAKAFPLVRPRPKLEDMEPLMAPVIPTDVPTLPQPSRAGGVWSGLLLISLAAAIMLIPRLRIQLHRS